MLWASWTTLAPILFIAFLLLATFSLVERRAAPLHLVLVALCALVYAASLGHLGFHLNLSLSDLSPHSIYMHTAPHINLENLDRFCEENATMLLFSAAVVWYAASLAPTSRPRGARVPSVELELCC